MRSSVSRWWKNVVNLEFFICLNLILFEKHNLISFLCAPLQHHQKIERFENALKFESRVYKLK